MSGAAYSWPTPPRFIAEPDIALVESRFAIVSVGPKELDLPDGKATRIIARLLERGLQSAGYGDDEHAALGELGRALRDVRPSWVREGHLVEVLVRADDGRCAGGRGETLGEALGMAAALLQDAAAARAGARSSNCGIRARADALRELSR